MQIPKTKECLVNLGTQILHIGQWVALKTLGTEQALHIIFGFYRYGLASNIFWLIFFF